MLCSKLSRRLSLDGSAIAAARMVPGNMLGYDPAAAMLLAGEGRSEIRRRLQDRLIVVC